MLKKILLFCFLFPTALSAKENWCSYSPDEIVLPLTFSVVDFSSACENHDICYFSLGKSKYDCDRAFLNDLREICDDKFNSWAHALHRSQCRGAAEVYHEGLVSGMHDLDRKSYEDAQDEMREMIRRMQDSGKAINDETTRYVARRLAELEADGSEPDDAMNQVFQELA